MKRTKKGKKSQVYRCEKIIYYFHRVFSAAKIKELHSHVFCVVTIFQFKKEKN